MKQRKPKIEKAIRDDSLLKERLKGHVEITPEQRVERDATISHIFQLRDDSATQAKLRKEKRDAEVFELLGGRKTTLSELDSLVTAQRSPYEPLFPNECGFWQEIFRLNGWHHLDPTEYVKPPVVGIWVCELIYNRYIKEVLPAVRSRNSGLGNGFWLYKHFQFLTPKGKEMLEQFRKDATELMKTCASWVEFRKQYLLKYGIGYQISMFEE